MSNVLLLVFFLSKPVGRSTKILLPIAGHFNLHILFGTSLLLEIMHHAVITAAISNPHSSCTIITNVPVQYYFTVYAELVHKGIGITDHMASLCTTSGFNA